MKVSVWSLVLVTYGIGCSFLLCSVGSSSNSIAIFSCTIFFCVASVIIIGDLLLFCFLLFLSFFSFFSLFSFSFYCYLAIRFLTEFASFILVSMSSSSYLRGESFLPSLIIRCSFSLVSSLKKELNDLLGVLTCLLLELSGRCLELCPGRLELCLACLDCLLARWTCLLVVWTCLLVVQK